MERLYIREIYYKYIKFFYFEIASQLYDDNHSLGEDDCWRTLFCTCIKFQFQMQISLNLVGAVGKIGVSVVLVVGRVEQGSETEFVKSRATNVDI